MLTGMRRVSSKLGELRKAQNYATLNFATYSLCSVSFNGRIKSSVCVVIVCGWGGVCGGGGVEGNFCVCSWPSPWKAVSSLRILFQLVFIVDHLVLLWLVTLLWWHQHNLCMSTEQQGSPTKYLSARTVVSVTVSVCLCGSVCAHTQGNQAIEGDLSAHQLRN